MKELLLPAGRMIWAAIVEEVYPEPAEGQKRRLRLTPAGVALLGVVALSVWMFAVTTKLDEVLISQTRIERALIDRGVMAAEKPARAEKPVGLVDAASAEEHAR